MPPCIGRDRLANGVPPVLRKLCNTSTIAESHNVLWISIVTEGRHALRRLHLGLDEPELGLL